jgi:hypothetical protein
MRALLTIPMVCGLLASPAFGQSDQQAPAAGATTGTAADLSTIPGLAILNEALQKGGFINARLVGQQFFLLEATAPEGGTVYLLISEKGAPIAPSGEGTPAPELGSSAGGSEASESGSSQ